MRFMNVALVGLALTVGANAQAAIISGTYAVTGSNFASSVTPPYASITESFTISFNNSVTVLQQTAGITLGASTITPSSPLAFNYIAGADTLIVGGTASSVATSDLASTDFALVINKASDLANFSIVSLTYSVGENAVFTARTTARATVTTPEPASIILLGTTFAVMGIARRRWSR